MDEAAQHAAQCGAGHPVKLVEQRDEEIEPPPVDPLRDLGGAIDAEGLIAHAIDEVGLFPAQSLKFIQHGNAVKKVPRLDHQRHQETLHRRVGRQQHAHRHKFQTPAKDSQAHQQRIPKAEAGNIHIDAIGHPQKPKSRKDGNGIGKSAFQRRADPPTSSRRAGRGIGNRVLCHRIKSLLELCRKYKICLLAGWFLLYYTAAPLQEKFSLFHEK